MYRVLGVAILGIFLMAGCSGGGTDSMGTDSTSSETSDSTATGAGRNSVAGTVDKSLAGDWRVISSVLYYDNGRNTKDLKATLPTRRLTVGDDGKWQFGSSNGTWTVAAIEDSDWKGWDVASYGPTRKIQIDGWADGSSKGPIEESTGPVDFFWVIYRYTSDTSGPGTVWMKFGKDM